MFKSTIIERRDVWFADEGPLIAKLCEDAEDSGEFDGITRVNQLLDCEAYTNLIMVNIHCDGYNRVIGNLSPVGESPWLQLNFKGFLLTLSKPLF